MQVDTTTSYANLAQYSRDLITVPEEEFRPSIPLEAVEEDIQEKIDEYTQEQEEQKDKTRRFIAGAAWIDSKKTQFEILLEGMNSEDEVIKNDNSLLDTLKILRDIQEQNSVIESYAKYKENQDLWRG